MSREFIGIAQPLIGDAEKMAVMEVLDSGSVAQGPGVAKFEEAFAGYCSTDHAVAVNSGTAALHCALHAANIGRGDRVITTPFSFIATVNPILMQGAEPKFADILPDTFTIDPKEARRAYEPDVKAIVPVDLYGQPADYNELLALAAEKDLRVIADACQSVGAEYHGRKAGAIGDIACFSLYATKNIMSAEGGVITTDDATMAADARSFRQHGMSGHYEYAQLGYNYRMTDILGALAIAQLLQADDFNRARQANAARLTEGLQDIEGLKTPVVAPDRTSVFHQYTLKVTGAYPLSRDEFVERMKANSIGAGVYYPKPLHYYPHIANLGYAPGDFPVAEKVARQVVSLPVHPGLRADQVDFMIETIRGLTNA